MRQRSFFDIFFSLSLMSVFVLCSALLLYFQINRFEQQKLNHEQQVQNRLAQSYITMKFHQRSAGSSIDVETIEAVDCLVMRDDVNETTTLIYVYDGYLRELYQSQQANLDLTNGDKITPVEAMKIEKDQNRYFFEMQFIDDAMTLQLSTY